MEKRDYSEDKQEKSAEDKISHRVTSYLKEALRYSCLDKVANETMNFIYQMRSNVHFQELCATPLSSGTFCGFHKKLQR